MEEKAVEVEKKGGRVIKQVVGLKKKGGGCERAVG